jgi:putative methyltransferase
MSTSPYHEAGKLMNLILTQKKSIKTVAFSKSKLTCSKSAYATVCNTIRNKSLLDSILNHDGGKLRKAIELDQARNQGLIYVLLYELLLGPYGNIRGGGKLKRIILKHEAALRNTKDKLVQNSKMSGIRKIGESTSDIPPKFPRYVRVNNLKTSMKEIVKELHQLFEKYQVASRDIYLDAHVPDLIVLSPNCPLPWHELEMVQQGRVILQDKSSCFSALAMVHGHPGGTSKSLNHDYMDACAAPGNKTSHLAALLYKSCKDNNPIENKDKPKGNTRPNPCKIFALDRSSSRHSILKQRMMQLAPRVSDPRDDHASQKCHKSQTNTFPVEICTLHQDFLQVDPTDQLFRNVKAILLDPSCSGSGIVNAPDRMADVFLNEKNSGKDNSRIQSLANFQLVALKHAMSFPQVDRIVYSTCSVNVQENEDVVTMALKETNDTISDDNLKWKLVSPRILSTWKRRGIHRHDHSLTSEEYNAMIRVNGLDGDETNGFFVSYFERVRSLAKDDSNNNNNNKNTTIMQSVPKDIASIGISGIYHPGTFPIATVTQSSVTAPKVKSTSTSTSTSTPKSTPEEDSNQKHPDKKSLPRKIAKKLKWKRKQMELKRQRLLQTQASSKSST